MNIAQCSLSLYCALSSGCLLALNPVFPDGDESGLAPGAHQRGRGVLAWSSSIQTDAVTGIRNKAFKEGSYVGS